MSSKTAKGRALAPFPDAPRVKVWDPVVRLFHWTVVTGCLLNLFVLEEGRVPHRYVGYGIAAVLLLRVVWGFVGTAHARFGSFLPTPGRVGPYVRALLAGREPRFLGHNPLAAVMMLALMLVLALTVGTGWMTTLDAFWGVEWVKELHGVLANSILVLAAIHALAAIVESRRQRENLVWSMVTGWKRAGTSREAADRRG